MESSSLSGHYFWSAYLALLDLRLNNSIPYFFPIYLWESHFLGRLIRSLQVPKETGIWNSQGGRKNKLFFPLHSLGLYNNNASCLRTVSGKYLLANHHTHRTLVNLITLGPQPCLTQWNQAMPAGKPKTGGSSWRGLKEWGPLEKGMAKHFSILALRTPWTVGKGKMIGYWKRNSPGH